jgi:hypothetical protein
MPREVKAGEKVINRLSWNAILIDKDGVPYSVNHYPPTLSSSWLGLRDKPEEVEIRYELYRLDHFEQLKVDPAKLGYRFDNRGYRIGSAFAPEA